MTKRNTFVFTAFLCLFLSTSIVWGATVDSFFDPRDFTSLGTLDASSGTITFDTTNLTVSGYANGVTATSEYGDVFAVYTFDSIDMNSGLLVSITGSIPIVILSKSDININTTININGGGATNNSGGYGVIPGVGVAGGGNGGEQYSDGYGEGKGLIYMDGDTIQSSRYFRAYGGGYGGYGGGDLNYAGAMNGDNELKDFNPGSGGSGNRGAAGGAGGGAIAFGALGKITLLSTNARIYANGGRGGYNSVVPSYGAGGSGGGILLYGTDIDNNGYLYANGGTSGSATFYGTGGGGGRIALYGFNVNAGSLSTSFVRGGSGYYSGRTGTVFTSNTFPFDQKPIADAHFYSTLIEEAVSITLSGSDADNDPLTFRINSGPYNGTLSGTSPNLVYTPNTGFTGNEKITYVANDGLVDSSPAVISISVTNNAPIAHAQNLFTPLNTSIPITLTGEDADNHPIQFSLVTPPSNGTLSGTIPNYTYTPNTDFAGLDQLVFKVNDGFVDSNLAEVIIKVNAPPIALNDSYVTNEREAVDIQLTATDQDALTYEVVSVPTNGSLTGSAPNLTYTPNDGFYGRDSLQFKAYDGSEYSNIATIDFLVNPYNISLLDVFEDSKQDIIASLANITIDSSTKEILEAIHANQVAIESASASLTLGLQENAAQIQAILEQMCCDEILTAIADGDADILTTLANNKAAVASLIDSVSLSVIDELGAIASQFDDKQQSVQETLVELINTASNGIVERIDQVEISLATAIDAVPDAVKQDTALLIDNASQAVSEAVAASQANIEATIQEKSDQIISEIDDNQGWLETTNSNISILEAAVSSNQLNIASTISEVSQALINKLSQTDASLQAAIEAAHQESSAFVQSASQTLHEAIQNAQSELDGAITEQGANLTGKIDENQSFINAMQTDIDALEAAIPTAAQSVVGVIESASKSIVDAIDETQAQLDDGLIDLSLLLDEQADLINSASDALFVRVTDLEEFLYLSFVTQLNNSTNIAIEQIQAASEEIIAEINQNEGSIANALSEIIANNNANTADLQILLNAINLGINTRDIEMHLMNGDALVTLFLPAAYGGQLETVQQLVVDLMIQVQAGGMDISNAQKEYDKALAHLENDEYKDAYDDFSKAYQELAKGKREKASNGKSN